MILIKRALYGLSASRTGWYRHFLTTLRHIGFAPTRFDIDFWINLAESGDSYKYMCTYVDDFMIASKAPEDAVELTNKEYHIKGEGPRD